MVTVVQHFCHQTPRHRFAVRLSKELSRKHVVNVQGRENGGGRGERLPPSFESTGAGTSPAPSFHDTKPLAGRFRQTHTLVNG